MPPVVFHRVLLVHLEALLDPMAALPARSVPTDDSMIYGAFRLVSLVLQDALHKTVLPLAPIVYQAHSATQMKPPPAPCARRISFQPKALPSARPALLAHLRQLVHLRALHVKVEPTTPRMSLTVSHAQQARSRIVKAKPVLPASRVPSTCLHSSQERSIARPVQVAGLPTSKLGLFDAKVAS